MYDTDVDDLLTSLEEILGTGTEPSFGAVDAPVFTEESLVSEAEASESALDIRDVIEILASSVAQAFVEAPASQSSEGPTRGSSHRFEDSINQAIRRCRRETRPPTCSWGKGFFVSDLFLTFERRVNDDICCCACFQAPECQAVHYERREGTCVFHQGPTLRRRRQSGTKRWVKQ